MLLKVDFYWEMKGKLGAIRKRGRVLGAQDRGPLQYVLAAGGSQTLSLTRIIEILAYFC